MKVVVVGGGNISLVSRACLVDLGRIVSCVDTTPEKIAALNERRIPIYEPGLNAFVSENLSRERLAFTVSLAGAIEVANAVFIAVDAPARRGGGFADFSCVYLAARDIARAVTGPTVVLTKSMMSVSTGDEVKRIVRETRPKVASIPDFLREGAAISDFKPFNRIVIGANKPQAAAVVSDLYRPIDLKHIPILMTSRRAAWLTNYAADAFLASKITFINEIGHLCEQVGADVEDVTRGIRVDNRMRRKFPYAGLSYGGTCFPRDTLALVKTAQDASLQVRVVETVVAVNDSRKRAMARKGGGCGGSVRGRRIAAFGLTFRLNADDARDAPYPAIITGLQDAGGKAVASDPEGGEQARQLRTKVRYAAGPLRLRARGPRAGGRDGVDAFLDLNRLHGTMAESVLVDLLNIDSCPELQRYGSQYTGVGRNPAGRNIVAFR